jgi:hypothetical protein
VNHSFNVNIGEVSWWGEGGFGFRWMGLSNVVSNVICMLYCVCECVGYMDATSSK